MAVLKRQPLFPHVIELNFQARRRISCSVYLLYDDDNNWTLIDLGYEDAVDECLEIIRQLDFPLLEVRHAHRLARRRRPHPGLLQSQADPQNNGHVSSARGQAAGERATRS